MIPAIRILRTSIVFLALHLHLAEVATRIGHKPSDLRVDISTKSRHNATTEPRWCDSNESVVHISSKSTPIQTRKLGTRVTSNLVYLWHQSSRSLQEHSCLDSANPRARVHSAVTSSESSDAPNRIMDGQLASGNYDGEVEAGAQCCPSETPLTLSSDTATRSAVEDPMLVESISSNPTTGAGSSDAPAKYSAAQYLTLVIILQLTLGSVMCTL